MINEITFQERLDSLLDELGPSNLEIHVLWMDEYGGSQSIIMGNSDKLVVRRKNHRYCPQCKDNKITIAENLSHWCKKCHWTDDDDSETS